MNKIIRFYILDIRHYMVQDHDVALCGQSIGSYGSTKAPSKYDCCVACSILRNRLISWGKGMVRENKTTYPMKEASPPEERFIYFDDLLCKVMGVMDLCTEIDDTETYQQLVKVAIYLDRRVNELGNQIVEGARP